MSDRLPSAAEQAAPSLAELTPLDPDRDVVAWLEPPGPFAEGRNLHLIEEGAHLAKKLDGSLFALALDDVNLASLAGRSSPETTLYQAIPIGTTGQKLEPVPSSGDEAPPTHAPATAVHCAAVLLGRLQPRVALMADGDFARETAAAVAHRLGSAAVLKIRSLRVGLGDNRQTKAAGTEHAQASTRLAITYSQEVYGGQLDQEVSFSATHIEIVALSLAPLDQNATGASRAATDGPFEIVPVEVPVAPSGSIPRRISLTPPNPRTVDISYAETLVAVGAGASDAECVSQVEELANLLQASLATTRPVVDDGLLPKERMVGQTGRTVSPDLYLALGISGSPHHVAGFQGAGTVLAVNNDVRAPIFQFSDTGYVGDVQEILPLLIRRLRGQYAEEGETS